MARPFLAPDPRDRSVNEPSTIISSTQVLGFYNQENPSDKKERVVKIVKDWYIDKMKEEGWDKADFHGNQCVLQVEVELKNAKNKK